MAVLAQPFFTILFSAQLGNVTNLDRPSRRLFLQHFTGRSPVPVSLQKLTEHAHQYDVPLSLLDELSLLDDPESAASAAATPPTADEPLANGSAMTGASDPPDSPHDAPPPPPPDRPPLPTSNRSSSRARESPVVEP